MSELRDMCRFTDERSRRSARAAADCRRRTDARKSDAVCVAALHYGARCSHERHTFREREALQVRVHDVQRFRVRCPQRTRARRIHREQILLDMSYPATLGTAGYRVGCSGWVTQPLRGTRRGRNQRPAGVPRYAPCSAAWCRWAADRRARLAGRADDGGPRTPWHEHLGPAEPRLPVRVAVNPEQDHGHAHSSRASHVRLTAGNRSARVVAERDNPGAERRERQHHSTRGAGFLVSGNRLPHGPQFHEDERGWSRSVRAGRRGMASRSSIRHRARITRCVAEACVAELRRRHGAPRATPGGAVAMLGAAELLPVPAVHPPARCTARRVPPQRYGWISVRRMPASPSATATSLTPMT
jgi:hypothetical protein